MSRTGSRLRAAFAGVLLVLASLVAMLLLLELGLRAFWHGYYLKDAEPYAGPHPTRGWANLPGVRMTYGEAEFNVTVVHDSRGFRSPEVADRKPLGKTRVLVLGDSFAWGVGVENDETFSARLEAADPRLEVINAGANGYGTAQELRLLLEEGLALEPDLVLVAFFWNDVANSYRARVPIYELEGDELRYRPPRLEVAETEAEHPVDALRRRVLRFSHLYRFASDRIRLLRYHVRAALDVPLERTELVEPSELEAAWRLELALLREIDRSARAHGAHCAIAIIPEQVQVQPDTPVLGLVERVYSVQERMRAFGEQSGIAMIDLLPPLREVYERDRVPLYYQWDRHLNARGHELVAQTLLDELRERALLPAPDYGVRKWNDFGRVSTSNESRERLHPRPESLTPVHASAGSR